MLSNILFSIRRSAKSPLFATISIAGLALGIASAFLIGLFVAFETDYETIAPDRDNIYRVLWTNNGTGATFATFFNPAAPVMPEMSGEVELAARLGEFSRLTRHEGEENTELMHYVDPDFLNIFEFQPRFGDMTNIFGGVERMALSESAAMVYFGRTDVVGETLIIDNDTNFEISAVFADLPSNTHLNIHFLTSLEVFGEDAFTNWGSDLLFTYVKLRPGADTTPIKDFVFDTLTNAFGQDARAELDITFQPLGDIHFTPGLENEISTTDRFTGQTRIFRDSSDILIFTGVGLFTLIISCINFMNLQIAQTSIRAREIGIRKVFGASRRQVVNLMFSETILMVMIAAGLGLTMAALARETFNELAGASVSASYFWSGAGMSGLLGLVAAAILLSGLYPALSVGSLRQNQVLHGETMHGLSQSRARDALVILQFAASIGLIVASLTVFSQIRFSMNQPLGYDREQVITLGMDPREARNRYETLRTELLSHEDITHVTNSSIIPTGSLSDGGSFVPPGGDPGNPVAARRVSVDFGFFETFGIELLAGRVFSDEFGEDRFTFPSADNPRSTSSIILNETAVRRSGWDNPEDAIGQQLYSEFNNNGVLFRLDYTVVGVAPDVHYRSFRSEVPPMTYFMSPGGRTLSLRTTGRNTDEVIAFINAKWSEIVPEFPISLGFLDESYADMYAAEQKALGLFGWFTLIAVLIACMGLYALTSFTAERRNKEIGIRKVLGASVGQIVTMLSWDLVKLVIVANVIAWPLAFFWVSDWLEAFAYRSGVDWTNFVLAGLGALIVAQATVSWRAVRAARVSPVLLLRHE